MPEGAFVVGEAVVETIVVAEVPISRIVETDEVAEDVFKFIVVEDALGMIEIDDVVGTIFVLTGLLEDIIAVDPGVTVLFTAVLVDDGPVEERLTTVEVELPVAGAVAAKREAL